MKFRRFGTLIAIAFAVAALPRLGFAQQYYSIININPASTVGAPTGVNDDYQVVGNDSTGKGFVWMPGVPSFHFDPTVSDTHYYGYAVNNLGQIGGTAWDTSRSAAVDPARWSPATYLGTTYSETLLYGSSSATDWPGAFLGINDDGYLCGTYQDTARTPLTFDGLESSGTSAGAIYANYEYTGVSNVFDDMCGTDLGVSPLQALFSHNFITMGYGSVSLAGGTFGAATYSTPSSATGIDDADDVVGSAHNSVTGNSEAFAWNGQTSAPYGPLGFLHNTAYSVANAINTASGIVVGQSGLHAFLWTGDITAPASGLMTDLNTLVESSSGWRLVTATALNDYGAIVGSGYYQQKAAGFLAIPVIINSITTPSPSSVVGGQTISGTVTLDAPAPFDMNVTVTSYSGKVNFGAGVYSTGVLISAGNTSADFVANTSTVTTDTAVVLKATFGGWRRYTTVHLLP
ncbi:MAG: hypothetical protein KGJ62_07465 [Armatimonadetes bacterium]|nr:hypothetical protein [Armatimonadota bacterium]MDE2207467.1 hypothetical protein [Armatimonadota bacterium]